MDNSSIRKTIDYPLIVKFENTNKVSPINHLVGETVIYALKKCIWIERCLNADINNSIGLLIRNKVYHS